MRARISAVLAVIAIALVAGCGGRSWPASATDFCAEVRADQVQLNQGGTPDEAQIVAAFDRLLRAAPSDIKPDVETVDAALRTTQANSSRALTAFLDPGYLAAAAHFKSYAQNKCGITLSTHHADAAPAPVTHSTLPAASSAARANANLPDPCALVSQATATHLFKATAAKDRTFGTLGRECIWVATNNGLTHRLRVWVVGDPFFYGSSLYPRARALTGVGDRAFVDTASALSGVTVSVQKGKTVLQLAYTEHSATGAVDLSTRADEIVAIAKNAVGAIR